MNSRAETRKEKACAGLLRLGCTEVEECNGNRCFIGAVLGYRGGRSFWWVVTPSGTIFCGCNDFDGNQCFDPVNVEYWTPTNTLADQIIQVGSADFEQDQFEVDGVNYSMQVEGHINYLSGVEYVKPEVAIYQEV